MHNWIIADIIEKYTNKSGEFIGHKYVIGCYTCDEVKIVREDTLEKMIKYNLIEVNP